MPGTSADDSRDGGPERTPDGRHILVGGRRWRASDPNIPEALRQELVNELMAARRGVRATEPGARSRVDDAKRALGERGAPWWEVAEGEEADRRIAAAVRALLRHRDGRTACPSDIARIVGGPGSRWRGRMDDVRRVTAVLAAEGVVVATQRGDAVDAATARGPIRIGRGPSFPEASSD